ncbi:hypothetical protein A3860_12320 [Niastella vici]|uniref:Uncharacterized protein n=1 Tax=Niastella vici TaxID=1703345 RepID=A0A1V9G6N7_9BACT|nr:hypothetical protein A3860_12320 [Niastella vici]
MCPGNWYPVTGTRQLVTSSCNLQLLICVLQPVTVLTYNNNKLINIFLLFFNEKNLIVLLNFNAFQSTNLTKPI